MACSQSVINIFRLGMRNTKSSIMFGRRTFPLNTFCATREFNLKYNHPLLSNISAQNRSPIVLARRFKKKNPRNTSSKNEPEDDDDDDEDDDANLSENPLLMEDLADQSNDGSEQITIEIGSLRLDVFTKSSFSMTRAKVEELFYKGDLLLNGERPAKKSVDLSLNDEIDVIKQINSDDNRLVDIKRAIIIGLPDKANEHGRIKVRIKRWTNLTRESSFNTRNED